jgi:hypothetical protein
VLLKILKSTQRPQFKMKGVLLGCGILFPSREPGLAALPDYASYIF